jgi:hypothetical protein
LGEELSIYHYITSLKREKARTVSLIYDPEGTPTISAEIIRAFSTHFRQNYDYNAVTDESVRRGVDCGLKTIPAAASTILEQPVIMDELLDGVRKVKTKKATGSDGICLQTFRRTWESSKEDMLALMSNMFKNGEVTTNQKHGIIVCVPKTPCPTRVGESRPQIIEHRLQCAGKDKYKQIMIIDKRIATA